MLNNMNIWHPMTFVHFIYFVIHTVFLLNTFLFSDYVAVSFVLAFITLQDSKLRPIEWF